MNVNARTTRPIVTPARSRAAAASSSCSKLIPSRNGTTARLAIPAAIRPMLSRTTTVAPNSAIGRFPTTDSEQQDHEERDGDQVRRLIDLAEDLLDPAELPPPDPHDDVVLPRTRAPLAAPVGRVHKAWSPRRRRAVTASRASSCRSGIRSSVSGCEDHLARHRREPRPRRLPAGADGRAARLRPAPTPAIARAGIAAIDAISSALGTVIRCPHFLQRPFLPATRGSTSNREPQLWQINTMPIAEPQPLSR